MTFQASQVKSNLLLDVKLSMKKKFNPAHITCHVFSGGDMLGFYIS